MRAPTDAAVSLCNKAVKSALDTMVRFILICKSLGDPVISLSPDAKGALSILQVSYVKRLIQAGWSSASIVRTSLLFQLCIAIEGPFMHMVCGVY